MMYREFHDAGYKFFGIKGVTDGACDCENPKCTALYKHPWFKSWQHTPLWGDEMLDDMEDAGQFAHGYGVLVNDGLLVIDVDARNGGVSSYAKLIEKIPALSGAGLIVETGSGGGSKHLYFTVPVDAALMQHHSDYKGIDFKSIGYVIGPGSKHISGNRYVAVVGDPSDIAPAPDALLELLKKPEMYRAAFDGKHIDLADKDIAEMLGFMSADCDHETWIKSGMAIHHATGGNGFDLWNAWSATSSKYPGADSLQRRWHSFGKSTNPVTIGTLIHYAKSAGWIEPVTFDAGSEFANYEETPENGLPFSIDGVDLLRPPGFVGEVAKWMESQSRRPRELLAVAGAIAAMGNVAGIRYTDDRDGVRTNLFVFCVAGSRTGKESIQQAVAQVNHAAGLSAATHGTIKSEQEITRNLIRHQPCLYILDEIGIFLRKVSNAQNKGGAPYLDGVIGGLMSIYSKVDSFLKPSGDASEELQQNTQRQAASIQKSIDENIGNKEENERRLQQVLEALDRGETGIEKPFLSMIGFTTPVTFDSLVDYESATNGFIGRALIFNERDTAPRSKRRFKKTPMPESMAATIGAISSGGHFEVRPRGARIENYEPLIEIPTDDKAQDMLDMAIDWFEDRAIEHKSLTGLQALYLGGYELLSKISLILACPEGRRTPEHVRWAFALVRNDINAKTLLVTSNEPAGDDPSMALNAYIMNMLDSPNRDLVKHGEIRNQASRRGFGLDEVEAALAKLVDRGLILVSEKIHARNKMKFLSYQLNSKE